MYNTKELLIKNYTTMNFSKSLLVLALSGVMLVSLKMNQKQLKENRLKRQRKVTAENLQTASFTIDGMSCAVGCAKTIEKKLAGLDGVQDAKVDFDKKTATVSYDWQTNSRNFVRNCGSTS